MLVVDDTVKANNFTRHLETSDLVAAVFRGQASFEKTCANGVKRGEFIAVAKQSAAAFDFAARGNHLV